MACSRPFRFVPQNRFGEYVVFDDYTKNYFPCGYCLNCRIDKRNSLQHRCERELIEYGCGAFVTFTYDDPHLIHNLVYDPQDSTLRATLSKRDCKKFLDRLNKIVHMNENNVLCNHNYKYLIVGEYGENGSMFDRPHFHALFFGLDFAYCRKMFERAWRFQGQITVGSIGRGAIPYVLKYLDKQLFGDLAKMKYDQHGLERPFQHHSCGLGSALYREQLDYAIEHNGCYRWHGRDVPYPTYFKNKYLIDSDTDYNRVSQNIFDSTGKRIYSKGLKNRAHFFRNIKDAYTYMDDMAFMFPEYKKIHSEKLKLAQLREKNINIKSQQNGQPMFDYDKLIRELNFYDKPVYYNNRSHRWQYVS